jgi:hypothetical protein
MFPRWPFLFYCLYHVPLTASFVGSPPTIESSTTTMIQQPPTKALDSRLGHPTRFHGLTASSADSDTSDSTVIELITPNKQRITLVGTAHLSLPSQEQVQAVMAKVQPNVVLVELDPSRLPRIGINGIDDIQVDRVVTAAEDAIPPDEDEGGFFSIFRWWQKIFLDGIGAFGRKWMSSMYDGMKDRQKLITKSRSGEVIPGGEFLVAIQAAEECPNCHTVVLGDRSSVATIQRAAQLAWKSGDALGVLKRLKDENEAASEELMQKMRVEIGLEELNRENYTREEEARLEMAVMEALKNDQGVRERMFERLEQKVPEFTQAFLKERDIIMSESIRRELERPNVETVVAVVGLAHISGIRDNLQASFVDAML